MHIETTEPNIIITFDTKILQKRKLCGYSTGNSNLHKTELEEY